MVPSTLYLSVFALCATLSSAVPFGSPHSPVPVVDVLSSPDVDAKVGSVYAPVAPLVNTDADVLKNVKPDVIVTGAKNARGLPLVDVLDKANIGVLVHEVEAPVKPVINTDVDVLNNVKPDVIVTGAKNARGLKATRTTPDHAPSAPKPTSVPQILVKLNIELDSIIKQIKACISVKDSKVHANIDIDLLSSLLASVEHLLAAALVDIKALIHLELKALLTLEGKVLSIVDLAGLLAGILHVVYTTLALVLCTVEEVKVHVIKAAIVTISKIVAEILVTVFVKVDGLKVALVPLVEGVVAIVKAIDVKIIIQLLTCD